MQEIQESSRQQMLARMLLHVIPAPGPVDLAVDLVGCGRLPVEQVPDQAILFLHGQDLRLAKLTCIVRLAAARGVEERPIQGNRGEFVVVTLPGVAAGQDTGSKPASIGIGPIEPVGFGEEHGWQSRREGQ